MKQYDKIKKQKMLDAIKAARRGSREAELEFENGFKAVNKIFKSKKIYTRKFKYKLYD